MPTSSITKKFGIPRLRLEAGASLTAKVSARFVEKGAKGKRILRLERMCGTMTDRVGAEPPSGFNFGREGARGL